jgi:hypothetical protein
MSHCINYGLLIEHLTKTQEKDWILDRDSSECTIDSTYLIFNYIDDTDCITVQLNEGELHIDSLRNDTLFDDSFEAAIELQRDIAQLNAA